MNNSLRFSLLSLLLMLCGMTYADAGFKDFAVIVNNQEGTLLTADEQVQGTEVNFGVAVADDGTVSRVAVGDASSVATVSGKYHSEHGCTNLKVVVPVEGSVKILVGQCTYSDKTIVVTNADGVTVASKDPEKACWKNDRSNVTELVYAGPATTLTITGPAYCPYVAVQKTEAAPVPQDITGTWSYANAEVMEATMAFSGSQEAGEVEAIEKNGLKMIVEANGASFRNNGDNIQVRTGAVFKIPVRSAGDLITVVGYPGYSRYTIGSSDEVLTDENTYIAKRTDAEVGFVAVTSADGNNYYKSLSVVQYALQESVTLDNEPATATFPFNEGTEGQMATFSNADYFLNSKVTYGEGLFIKDKNNGSGFDMTRFEPTGQNNSADETNAIRFLIQPKPGFVFTPTKVSLKTTRFGTDNGLLDIAWQNADGTAVTLATEVKPNRNNGANAAIASEEGQKFSDLSYEVSGSTPGEGVCGLLVNLYHLQSGKQVGFADIIIEGVLNGTEKDVPVLASFKANGKEYAAEDVFGDLFEATLELVNGEPMISAENPLTDVTAVNGTIGELTYEGTETSCKVTIPLTAGELQMDYVLNVVYKPYFTLEYIDCEGNVIVTQQVEKDAAIGEFALDIADVAATKDGYKACGWFKKAVLGEKFTTADVITANTRLYAIQTEIEEVSTHKKYTFNLGDQFFYAEDHEAFNPSGDKFYFHDNQHGWAFSGSNKIDLLVGPKATVTVTLCRYGSANDIVVTDANGNELGTLPGKNNEDVDGEIVAFNYEGEGGTITLNLSSSGEMYIHGVKIANIADVNFDTQGDWYIVKAGDAGSLLDVLDVVNGKNASKDAPRSFIFLPDGTYDLDATVKTAISGHNISIIGQSMDNTIIVTKPDKSIEGLGSADMLHNSGSNLYLQDLTLKNALDYYGALSGGQVGGRAAVLQDAGTRTIGKNVRMLSYQDTYYSSNASQQAYWENCDIHGTVDFICGGGDVRFQNTTISLEPRNTNGSGGRTVTAPTTTTQFGYVFDGCNVVDLAQGKGDWNFGRTWQNLPICVFLNTTLDDNAKNTLVSSRWTQKGMNNKDPKLFGEYGTKDAAGNDITPASNIINSFGGTFETILTAEQAAEFAYDKMFTDWNPAESARQIDAEDLNPAFDKGAVTFSITNDGMLGAAIFRNGVFVGISFDGLFSIDVDPATDELSIRAINPMGGFGPAAHVAGTTTAIKTQSSLEASAPVIYNLQGLRVQQPVGGLYIVNGKKIVMK